VLFKKSLRFTDPMMFSLSELLACRACPETMWEEIAASLRCSPETDGFGGTAKGLPGGWRRGDV
jgi:hypothetical protein